MSTFAASYLHLKYSVLISYQYNMLHTPEDHRTTGTPSEDDGLPWLLILVVIGVGIAVTSLFWRNQHDESNTETNGGDSDAVENEDSDVSNDVESEAEESSDE